MYKLCIILKSLFFSTRVKRQYYGGMYGGYASPYGMGYNPYTFATYPNMYGGYGGYGAGYGAGYGTGYGGYGGYGMYSGMGYGLYGK